MIGRRKREGSVLVAMGKVDGVKHKKKKAKDTKKSDATICGYTVVPYRITTDSTVTHYLYCKPYNPDHITAFNKYHNRILLLLSVPPFCNESNLQEMMSSFGEVEAVHFTADLTSQPYKPSSSHFTHITHDHKYQMAYVIYKRSESLSRCTNNNNTSLVLSAQQPIITGLQRQISEYNEKMKRHSDVKSLQREVDQYVADYDKAKATAQQQQQQVSSGGGVVGEGEESEGEGEGEGEGGGWVTVSRAQRTSQVNKMAAPRTEKHIKRVMAREKKKREQKELLNFYTFQVREEKKNRVRELREKFEEDKRRVAEMRSAAGGVRKFKPY